MFKFDPKISFWKYPIFCCWRNFFNTNVSDFYKYIILILKFLPLFPLFLTCVGLMVIWYFQYDLVNRRDGLRLSFNLNSKYMTRSTYAVSFTLKIYVLILLCGVSVMNFMASMLLVPCWKWAWWNSLSLSDILQVWCPVIIVSVNLPCGIPRL